MRLRLRLWWHDLWCDWCANAHLGRFCDRRPEEPQR